VCVRVGVGRVRVGVRRVWAGVCGMCCRDVVSLCGQAYRHLDKLFPNLLTFTIQNLSLGQQIREIIFEACKPVRKDQQKRDSTSRGY
jgi:hypothetical protein